MSAVFTFAPGPRRQLFSRRRRNLSSITWGNRSLGLVTPDGTITDRNTVMPLPLVDGPLPIPGFQPGVVVAPFPGNPDTRPGAWPGLNQNLIPVDPGYVPGFVLPNQTTPLVANGGPAQVPKVVVTPTSGTIPSPADVAAASAAPASWLEQSLIGGIANKWLLLGGLGAFLFFGGKKK
jgi:hypothetical protein